MTPNLAVPTLVFALLASITVCSNAAPTVQKAIAEAPAAVGAPTAAATQTTATTSLESAVSGRSVDGQLNALDRTRPFPVADKRAYFTNIKDGDKLRSPFRVAFSVSGMGVAPVAAGKMEGTGHHHILINRSFPMDIKAPIPFDKPGEFANQQYKHFGKGETETVLDLPPGKHTLQLLFADHLHVPYYIRSGILNIEVIK
ncbi:MAG: DUF4399 domain-containing protein [Pseudomonadota bacterium]